LRSYHSLAALAALALFPALAAGAPVPPVPPRRRVRGPRPQPWGQKRRGCIVPVRGLLPMSGVRRPKGYSAAGYPLG
jgi:hypothetical protein